MAAFSAGNIIVYRVGTGAAALTNAATAAFLDEYTQAGVLVQSIALPATANTMTTGNDALTASGTATSEGQISDSANGQDLLVAGYNITSAANGGATTSATGSTASTTANQRVIGVVNQQGVIDSTTNVGAFDSGNNARSAASVDGKNLYIGTPNGVAYTTDGSVTTPTTTDMSGPAVVDTTNTRATQIDTFNGTTTLYYSSSSNGAGIYSLATPPTANVSTSTTTDAGTLLASSTSPYGFFFANLGSTVGTQPDTLYVADSTSGVEKFTLNGNGTYNANGTLALSGASGITGVVNNGVATLFATTPGGLYKFTDTGGATGALALGTGSLSTPLVAAPTNEAFRSDALAPVCYVEGSLIRTVKGDVAVEHLAVGDVVVTAAGVHRPIRWIGSRHIDCRRHPEPHAAMPVRVRPHAFGENRPARDLLVSPGHALCVDVVDEVLIMAGSLVNGSTITQDDVDSVTYWHVELDSHDILLAENMPAESYLEMGNRSFFAENGVVALDGSPDARPDLRGDDAIATHADFCRPFLMDGPLVDVVRVQLAGRAGRLGWHLEEQGMGDLHLMVDGGRIEPRLRNLAASFTVPEGARAVWLVSTSGIAAHTVGSPDQRRLGVCLRGLTVVDGFGEVQPVALDDERLCIGFHGVEADADGVPYRWTGGRARLPASLWEAIDGDVFLRVDTTGSVLPRWIAPETERSAATRVGIPHTLAA